MTKDALIKAIELTGSQSALAKAMGVKQGHVYYWLRKGVLPAEYILSIERATNGLVTRYELRPDLSELFNRDTPHPPHHQPPAPD